MAYLSGVASSLHSRFEGLDADSKKRLVKISACAVGVIALGKACIYTYSLLDQRRVRQKKLNQTKTTKGKLLQKLVGLKTPMDNRNSLTALSYADMQAGFQSGDLRAVDLLEAFQARALELDRSLNCVCDVVYDADVTALYLDSLAKEQRGRLHGIPLSTKESISMAGYDAYLGCITRCFNPEQETASVVEALEKEGMIPFARTIMSQIGMSIACESALFGETVNAHSAKRTSGGSSGGEGALIGGRGSIAGIGTDLGGSIRVPCSYNGIYGLKPTYERVGRKNMPKSRFALRGPSYRPTTGPMAGDFDLLVDMTRVLFSPSHFDLNDALPRLPFDEATFSSSRPLTVGFYTSFSDNYLSAEPIPAVQRAVLEAKTALERRGHTVVPWEPPRIAYACDLMVRSLFADRGAMINDLRQSELLLVGTPKRLSGLASLKPSVKMVIAALMYLTNPVVARFLLRTQACREPADVIRLTTEADAYKEECGLAWESAGLDAVICPVVPFAAPRVGDTQDLMVAVLYCNMYNLLDYPAGVVPVTKVTADDCAQLRKSYPRRGAVAKKVVATMAEAEGMPVGVQCVAKKWRDETALRVMAEVKKGLE